MLEELNVLSPFGILIQLTLKLAGECYRLCTKKDFDSLFDNSPPEIIRTNLASAILQMKVK